MTYEKLVQNVKKNAESFTKAQLAEALVDVLDGSSQSYEILNSTGLKSERCVEISQMFAQLVKEPPKARRKHSRSGTVHCDICAPLRCSKADSAHRSSPSFLPVREAIALGRRSSKAK